MFDWIAFLDRHGVPWVGPGTNVSQGHLGIACPLCGDDPSEHLGINTTTGAWSCWRDQTHKGSTPVYIIQRIARCSRREAELLWSGGSAPKADLLELERLLQNPGKFEGVIRPISWGLDEFELDDYLGVRFLHYLKTRGFQASEWVAKEYHLRGAVTGNHAHRLLFPLEVEGKLYGWSGRAIAPSRIRYKTHPIGPQVRNLIYNYDQAAQGGDLLVICEGPVDALRIDSIGRTKGIRAIGLLGTHLTKGKLKLITRLIRNFSGLRICLDSDALAVSIRLRSEFSFFGLPVEIKQLPAGTKDPGELSEQSVIEFFV